MYTYIKKNVWVILYVCDMLQAKYENYVYFLTPICLRQCMKYWHFYHVNTFLPNYIVHPPEDCNIHIHCLADLKSHIPITYFVHCCLEDWNSIPGLGRDYSHHHVHNSSQPIQPSVPWAQGDPFLGQGRRSVKMTTGLHRAPSLRIRENIRNFAIRVHDTAPITEQLT